MMIETIKAINHVIIWLEQFSAVVKGRMQTMECLAELDIGQVQLQEETMAVNAKDYLNRAYKLDKRIDSKIEQVASLRELATKATAVLTHEPRGGSKNVNAMENNIVKIMDLENDIAADINELLDLKHEISEIVDLVQDTDCKLLLEYRYISLKSWEDICLLLNYSWRSVGRLHSKALKMVQSTLMES